MQCNLSEAPSRLTTLIEAALTGEDVVIAKQGIPLVRLVKVESPVVCRKPGLWANLPDAAEDWDAPETNAALAEELVGSDLP